MKNNSINDIKIEGSGENLIIDDDSEKTFDEKENSSLLNKIKIKCLNTPFIFYLFIFVFLFSISVIIFYCYYYNNENPNFKEFYRNWLIQPLNNREYTNYLFDNGLEVMLIHDPLFDRDGGSLVIEKGYLDYPFEEGLSTFVTYLLCHIAFDKSPNNIKIIQDYFGNFKYGIIGHFINFRFDILNNGFKKFLAKFSTILDFENSLQKLNKIEFDDFKKKILDEMYTNYKNNKKILDCRENHLIEYFVYGLKNESEGEILPEGNIAKLKNINIENISEYLIKLINPSKIKIVLFSKYKFLISSKYMKYYYYYLTHKSLSNNEKENKSYTNDFITSQIFFIKANYYDSNYIKIIYYINKIGNESYSELSYKQYYFNYISDFLSKTKNGSLYSIICNSVKSITSTTEIVFKSKIKFSITIELNSLENINDIIYTTYRYIYKITNETIQMDRYEELKDIYINNRTLTEKTYNTIELAYANAMHLVESKYAEYYYFYFDGIPWNKSINNYETIPKEVEPYFKQLRPNNSIIVLAIRDKDKNNLTCNKESKFKLNCERFKDNKNINRTYYYDVFYINDTFNSSNLEENLKKEESNDFNITFENNIFKSKYNETDKKNSNNEEIKEIKFDNNMTLNKFFFKSNHRLGIQRVIISFNLYHPYLRPNNTSENCSSCYYFLIMEMFSAIKRKINEKLIDAKLAENKIYFGQTENNLYILVYCFSDKAFEISNIIKYIIYDEDWTNDFIKNKEIYKKEVFEDFFIYNKNNIQDISRFYFKSSLKKNVYNKYEFFPDDFEINHYNKCINYFNQTELTSFIIDTYIYGFIDEINAVKIFKLFNYNNSIICGYLLNKVNIIEENITTFVDWIKTINNLDINESNKTIKETIYNKTEDGGNIGFTYRIYQNDSNEDIDKLSFNLSIFQNIADSALKNENSSSLKSIKMIYYKNLFFELIFSKKENNDIIPNEKLVGEELDNLTEGCLQFNQPVDNIGNRYYYLIKNYILSIDKKQKSLYDEGIEEINRNELKGTTLNYENIIQKNENKNINQNELNDIINDYIDKLKKANRINIFTSN